MCESELLEGLHLGFGVWTCWFMIIINVSGACDFFFMIGFVLLLGPLVGVFLWVEIGLVYVLLHRDNLRF